MKRLLLFFCLLAAITANGQSGITYQGTPTSNVGYNGTVGGAQGLFVAPVSSLGTGRFNGHIKCKTDATCYMWNGTSWLQIGSSSDTTGLSARINQRVKYTDTAPMLSPYLLSSAAAGTYLTSSSALNATNLTSGTIPAARYGVGTIDVSKLTGTLPTANGGTGTTTPGMVAGTNISITGTWPNQTVNSTGGNGLRAIDTPSLLASQNWNPTVIGNTKVATISTDTTFNLTDSVNGQEAELHTNVIDTTARLKFKYSATDSGCFHTSYLGHGIIMWKNVLGNIEAYPGATWSKTTCPIPAPPGPHLLTADFPGGYTGAGSAWDASDELFPLTTTDCDVTVAGTVTNGQIYIAAGGGIYVTKLWIQVWHLVSGTTYSVVGTLTKSSGFTDGLNTLTTGAGFTVSVSDKISVGYLTGTSGAVTVRLNSSGAAKYLASTPTGPAGSPKDWGAESSLGYHIPVVLNGN